MADRINSKYLFYPKGSVGLPKAWSKFIDLLGNTSIAILSDLIMYDDFNEENNRQ